MRTELDRIAENEYARKQGVKQATGLNPKEISSVQ